MNKIPELNPIEKKLKQFYRKSKERMLDVPCTRDEIMDVLLSSYTAMPDKNITQSLKTQIDEQIFILENMDVSFVRHARYTPAFWHNHDFFEMIFVQSGGCINYIFDRNISMQTGDICIMAPDITHSLSAFHDEDVIMNILIRKSTFEQSFFGLLDDNTFFLTSSKELSIRLQKFPIFFFIQEKIPFFLTSLTVHIRNVHSQNDIKNKWSILCFLCFSSIYFAVMNNIQSFLVSIRTLQRKI